jgi:hypothetical protein
MTDAAAAAPVATATPTTSSPLPPRAAVAVDRSPQLLVGFAVLLLGVAFLPPLYSPAIASRLPVVLVAGAVGLVGLVRLAPRDPTARWLAGLLLWSLVAAIASGARWLALAPGVGSDKGWLVLAAFGGWWALGRRSPRGADDLVLGAIGVGVAINALIAILQSTVGSANPASPLYESGGRSSGLMGNPVFLAAFLAAGVAAIASASVRSERLPVRVASLATVTVGALGLNLSGGRIGAMASRRRRHRLRHPALAARRGSGGQRDDPTLRRHRRGWPDRPRRDVARRTRRHARATGARLGARSLAGGHRAA